MRVLTMGTFDLLHPGHVHLLNWCRSLAGDGPDRLVIATVNSDDFVERYKGRRPVMGEEDRRAVVSGVIGDVGQAWVHRTGENAQPTINRHVCYGGIIAIGADWRDRDYLGQLGVTQEWLDERDIGVVYVPLLAGHSSTKLREAMADG